jgi:RNA polymerase sigma factor for flagellar operon FliA
VQGGAQVYGELAAKARRDELILTHLGLVRHVVGKLLAHLPASADQENLEAAGVLGLVEAAAKFDPERGIRFETFAYTRIRGAVLDELRRNNPLPQHVFERLSRVRKAYERLPAGATLEALAQASGLSADDVVECLAAMRLTRVTSLEGSRDAPVRQVTDERQQRPDQHAEQSEQKQLLTEAITALPERERLVVTLYYLEDLRLREIGEVLNLSESRVSRLLTAALFEMAEYIRARES